MKKGRVVNSMEEENSAQTPRKLPSMRIERALASLGGVGYAPRAPGTLASVVVWPLWLFVGFFDFRGFIVAVVVISALAWLVCYRLDRGGFLESDKDPSWVVIDEVAGLGLAVIPFALHANVALYADATLYTNASTALLALVLFRFFDIVKPAPISHAEKLKGATGIVLDDLVAGAMAAGVAWMLIVAARSLL